MADTATNSNMAKLVELLGSRNRAIRREAIDALAQIPFESAELATLLHANFRSSLWEARVATADALEAILNASVSRLDDGVGEDEATANSGNATREFAELARLDLRNLIGKYSPLLSCADTEYTNNTLSKVNSKSEQRKLVDLHLEIYQTGVSSSGFIGDEEFSAEKSVSKSSNDNKQELKCDISDGRSTPPSSDADRVETWDFATSLRRFLRVTFEELLCPDWQRRHGAALALTKIVLCLPLSLLSPIMERTAVRLLHVLALDRFTDFVTGCSAVAPVREAAAQALSLLMLKASAAQFSVAVTRQLASLLEMKKQEQWQSRFTALLVLKYYFAVCPSASDTQFLTLFERAVDAVGDADDEVISRAIVALSAFFANPKVGRAVMTPLIGRVMTVIWQILLKSEQLFELMEDVNSLLIDLLGLIQSWLRMDETATFDAKQYQVILRLLDARFVARSTRAFKCIGTAVEKSLRILPADANPFFVEENIFTLVKAMYRCILFASCLTEATELDKFFGEIFSVLSQLLAALGTTKLAAAISLEVVKCWFTCLIYSHRQLSIEVYRHFVDGTSSTKSAPEEMLCGEEVRSLGEEQLNDTLTNRKVIAGRFLAALLDAVFRSDPPSAAAAKPHDAVQIIFVPYLQRNLLYHRMGAAIVVNCMARFYRQATLRPGNSSVPSPNILIATLEALIFPNLAGGNAPKTSYTEVEAAVNALTSDINEFQQYCTVRGVPREELAPENAADMEQVARAAYLGLRKRLSRPVDLDSLEVRYNVVLDSIRSARIAYRTNTSRVDTLLISSLLYFGHPPPTFTPLVRPLLEAANVEENSLLIEEIFHDAIPMLIELAARKGGPTNTTAKLLKTLASSLCHCDNFAPKIENWKDPEKSLLIYSLENAAKVKNISVKSRNIRIIVESLCNTFGHKLVDVCKEINELLSLDVACKETFLVHLELLGVVHGRLGCDYPNLAAFTVLYDGDVKLENFVTGDKLKSVKNEPGGPHFSNDEASNSEFLAPNGKGDLKSASSGGEDISENNVFESFFEDFSKEDAKVNPSAMFARYLSDANPAVRFRVARFLADFAALKLPASLNLFYAELERMAGDFSNDAARCGAAELLSALAEKEHEMLGAVSLLAPLALKAISDPIEAVRTVSANAFGKFVALLALEKPSKYGLSTLREHVREKYEASRHFSQVLSCPAALPIVKSAEIPHLRVNVFLRAYQLEGITWMCHLNRFGLNGILADDMGLGKTLQVLCVLAIEQKNLHDQSREHVNPRPTQTSHVNPSDLPALASLIVCPKTLTSHWCREWVEYFPTAAKSFKTSDDFAFVGAAMAQKFLFENWSADLVLVLSYSEVRALDVLRDFRWNCVVLDEGHCIRNPANQLYKSVTSLVSRHRLILSGTPVQNSPADLWALFTYLMPGYLSSKAHFNATYLKKIMASRNPKATDAQTEESEKALKNLHHRVLPFILRRMKADVLTELPEKVVQDYPCQLTDLQKQLYALIVDNSGVGCCGGKQQWSSAAQPLLSPLHTLILLRKLVDHPALVAKVVSPFVERNGTRMAEEILLNLDSVDYELSGKMIALKELLHECQIGVDEYSAAEWTTTADKTSADAPIEAILSATKKSAARQRALVFCQWRASLELVAGYIERGVFGAQISYLRLDGSVAPSERQCVVDRFNHDSSIDLLLLTTHIGGMGLTLTGANVVIFVDHDWNPVVDLQAIDRAHRLGQTRTVNVYRLITQGSIEEKVMNLQKFKSDTANVLIGADNRSLTSMAASDLRELFSLEQKGSSTPMATKREDGGDEGGEAIPAKRAKMYAKVRGVGDTNAAVEETYSLEALWDSTQYDEEHSIEGFIEKTTNVVG